MRTRERDRGGGREGERKGSTEKAMLVGGADDIEGHLPLRYRYYRDARGGSKRMGGHVSEGGGGGGGEFSDEDFQKYYSLN